MPVNTTGKNVALDALGTACTYAALYTDDTATTEVTGGSYARKSITWASASSGSKALSNAPVFDVPAGATVKAVGFLTASTGGTQHAFHNLTDETFAAAGTYTLTAGSVSLT